MAIIWKGNGAKGQDVKKGRTLPKGQIVKGEALLWNGCSQADVWLTMVRDDRPQKVL